MSAFLHGFNHGFNFGMFGNMFGGAWCNPFRNSFGGGWCSPFNNFWGGCNFGNFWNIGSMFMVPRYDFNNFVQYSAPGVQTPSIWQASVPNFTTTPFWQNYNFSAPVFNNPNLPSLNPNSNTVSSDTFVRSESNNANVARMTNTSVNDKYFDKMLNYLLGREGGYVNDPADSGGETNRGVTKATYDAYRKRKGLPIRNVREITNEEIREIYHDFFTKSGADKIDNPRMALMVFEVATGSGCAKARELFKKSGGDFNKMVELRREWYADIVRRRPKDRKFIKGWNNRLTCTVEFANANLPDKVTA